MPYTRPSQRSPAGSADTSPSVTRRPSWQNPLSWGPPAPSKSDLPRSASYLARHRQTPSNRAPAFDPTLNSTAPPNSDGKQHDANQVGIALLRQSPPPVTGDSKIPAGAITSPPDSAVNSSDDEEAKTSLSDGQLENLAELQTSVRIMEQQRDSFSSSSQASEKAKQGLALIMLAEELENKQTAAHFERLAAAPRKLGHTRSSTEPAAFIDPRPADTSETPSTATDEEISDEEFKRTRRKHPMVRKKSGELVRPSLRPPSAQRRPSSMPGTPTFSKAVHFDAHLEHIRHFLQVDKPLAVSAGSSSIAAYDYETEFPFDASYPFEWAIVVYNL
jgi:hypothetical protein